jgi:hypothetical protein
MHATPVHTPSTNPFSKTDPTVGWATVAHGLWSGGKVTMPLSGHVLMSFGNLKNLNAAGLRHYRGSSPSWYYHVGTW